MNAPATPDFDLVHRTDRVTNISPASDAFVLITLATLFFTIACFGLWVWLIWRKGQKCRAQQADFEVEPPIAEPVTRLPDHSATEDEKHPAPWEKPADWWKK